MAFKNLKQSNLPEIWGRRFHGLLPDDGFHSKDETFGMA